MTALFFLKTASHIITRHIVRSILTVLGITIGIAAIIVTFGIGSGAEKRIRSQILAMGERAIYIIPGNIIERGMMRPGGLNSTKLTESDLDAILELNAEGIAAITRGHDSSQKVEHGTQTASDRVQGVDPTLLAITGNKLRRGVFFTEYDLQHRINVAVLCFDIAEKLFGKNNPVGQTILIKKIPFTVIGVLEKIDHFFGVQNPNMRTYVPFTVAKKYFASETERPFDLNYIGVGLRAHENPGKVVQNVKRTIRFLHKTKAGESDDFTVFDQQSIADSAAQASQIIKLFGSIAASISLFVGGIGVMNIMLVSVHERVREIGIRLSLGATQRLIQIQFLFESVLLCGVGGILGIIMGLLLQLLLSSVTSLPGDVQLVPLLAAFFVTIGIGIFFGFYPARKASRLNPVDALADK